MTQEPGARLAEVLDGYIRGLEAGDAPDRETLLKAHPDLAEDLEAALLGLEFVRGAAPSLDGGDGDAGKSLGDYRLLREIGRGGMAVVYEAEQISLGRRVALKVLPFAAVLDPKQLQRFKNEALAAAHLQHPHIVPVHGVGCERGVHYYAMQYIEGQSLAAAIRDMRGGGAGEGPRSPISSHGSNREPEYIRMAAQLGAQAAEALDHAHQLGIVHRDVKPANLLVDQAGALWITDFGLARSLHDAGLTVTGELLGTVRYMSPEQALAKRAPIDHRTDVYSLGATLYELFTLEPAFPGDDPHVVIQDIASKEPAPPRRLNPALPRDLETVVLKAMSKDAAARYATAREMADDIRRCLEDKPILARRPSVAARAARWSRRHRGLVAAALAVLFVGVAALAVGAKREERNTRAALARADAALGEARTNLGLARSAVEKFLVEAGAPDWKEGPLPSPARAALLRDALSFYEAQPEDPTSLPNRLTILHALGAYDEALAMLDRALAKQPRDAAALVARGHILWHLRRPDESLAALDRALTESPNRADAHDYRGRALLALGRLDDALAAYDRAIQLNANLAYVHIGRGDVLLSLGRLEEALAAYDRTLAIEPHNPSAFTGRGNALHDLGRFEEALAAHDRSIEIQPEYGPEHANRGDTLLALGRAEEALTAFDRSIELDPDDAGTVLFPASRRNAAPGLGPRAVTERGRGNALVALGRAEEALAAFDCSIEIDPDDAGAHRDRGKALVAFGRPGEAIAAFDRAIELDPNDAAAHHDRGNALVALGRVEEGVVALRRSLAIDPSAATHYNIGNALRVKGDPDGAILEFLQAIRIRPDHAKARCNLANVLKAKGETERAVGEYLGAIRVNPDLPEARLGLGNAYLDRGEFGSAIEEYREAIRCREGYAKAYSGLGAALAGLARFREAVPPLKKGLELGSIWPSEEWIAATARRAALEERMERVLSGDERPRDAPERIEFAGLFHAKSLHAGAARMFAEAFAEDAVLADDLARRHRYNAACCAALAAAPAGPGAAEWRARALGWLRADLAARQNAATDLAQALGHWKRDPDLVSIRDRIDELPEAEREGWRSLWAAVDRALAGASSAGK